VRLATYLRLHAYYRPVVVAEGANIRAISARSAPPGRVVRSLRAVCGWEIWRLPSPLREYLVGISVLTVAAAAAEAAPTPHLSAADIGIYVALLGCGIVAIETTRGVREVQGTVLRDLQTVWYLAIAIVLPPVCAFFAPLPLAAYKSWRVRRGLAYRRVFSSATISLAYGCASVVFHLLPRVLAGANPGSGAHILRWTGMVACCGVLAWVINNGLLLMAIRLANTGAGLRDLFTNREAITSDLLELSLAVSLSLVVAINPVLMVLALPSLVFYRRYLLHAQHLAHVRIDSKTGLLNAGTWQREAEVEFFRAVRSGTPLAIAKVDIDHFKDIDATAGQVVRDQLLRDIASMLKDQLPGQELIGRFGREEFAILLPQADREQALRISERLRDHIAGETIAIESGNQAGFIFRMTVSIGVAMLTQSRRALGELIGAADSALDQARSTGWSKVYVLPDGTEETGPL
jgi:diguanylate cyclase (GGDEF)-like protein